MTQADIDIKYMQRCIQLARCGEAGAAPNPMVGAVVVCDGRIIGEGYHRRCGGPHAEVNAIGSVVDCNLLTHSTIYVSLEPCAHYGKTPPCADLIIQSGIPRVVVGCTDSFAKVDGLGIQKLKAAGCEVTVGVLEAECRALNERFFTFHEKRRPWITLKWAQSQDGYIDRKRTADEAPAHLSSALTQTLVHKLRARSQAILVGTRTAVMDNPTLSTRHWEGPSPLRLTIDRKGILPTTLHLLDGTLPTIIYTKETLQELLTDLHGRGVQSLIVEGGARLLQSFIDEGLWDEARIETAPFNLGNGTKSPILQGKTLVASSTFARHLVQQFRPKR